MTPRQIELARHALGLPNGSRKSYRNRYLSRDGSVFQKWQDMVAAGLAVHHPPSKGQSLSIFCLTLAGATAALMAGESLDREDFPQQEAA